MKTTHYLAKTLYLLSVLYDGSTKQFSYYSLISVFCKKNQPKVHVWAAWLLMKVWDDQLVQTWFRQEDSRCIYLFNLNTATFQSLHTRGLLSSHLHPFTHIRLPGFLWSEAARENPSVQGINISHRWASLLFLLPEAEVANQREVVGWIAVGWKSVGSDLLLVWDVQDSVHSQCVFSVPDVVQRAAALPGAPDLPCRVLRLTHAVLTELLISRVQT